MPCACNQRPDGNIPLGVLLVRFQQPQGVQKIGYLEILVALAPGMLTAVLGLVVTLWEPMKMRLKE